MVGVSPYRWNIHGGRPESQRLQSISIGQLVCKADAASRIIYGFAGRREREITTIVSVALSCSR